MKRILCLAAAALLLGVFSGCSKKERYVYYLNYKPEADAAWQQLAADYTAQTGVPVKVVTAASGSYADTLSTQLGKAAPPTLYICNKPQDIENLREYVYDLRSSRLAERIENDVYCLKGTDGELYGVGFCYEAFGIITNKKLLAQAGYSPEDIRNFDDLKTVAEDIHARRDTLGFDAFTSSGLDGSSSWRFSAHLSNMPLYYEFGRDSDIQPAQITGEMLDLYKNIWDLYVQNSSTDGASLSTATGNMAEEEFGTGKAVFFQNGTWEYAALTDPEGFAMAPEDLTMLPIYCGAEGEESAGLCCGTENYWTVNSQADPESIEATLDFLDWIVTSEEGKTMLAEQFGVTPFADRLPTENVLFKAEEQYEAEGRQPVSWTFCRTPNPDVWRAGVVSALTAYSAGSGSWDDVRTAFVDGWRFQYRQEHGGRD